MSLVTDLLSEQHFFQPVKQSYFDFKLTDHLEISTIAL